MNKEEIIKEIEERLNHSWDGKFFAYQDNACEYVEITDIVEDAQKAQREDLLEKIEGMNKAECIFCGHKYTHTYCKEKKAYVKALEDIKQSLK